VLGKYRLIITVTYRDTKVSLLSTFQEIVYVLNTARWESIPQEEEFKSQKSVVGVVKIFTVLFPRKTINSPQDKGFQLGVALL
jgi:hypothetical protein